MAPKPSWMGIRVLLDVVVLVFSLVMASGSSSMIKTLPGYSGDLPFSLETGYVGVGENETVQLFYYFVESQRNPSLDPLMLWITGGPGCSSLAAFFFESGPLTFKTRDYNGSIPTLELNPYAWTQGLNIIYMDGPVGTGYSYSKTNEGYYMDDEAFVAQSYEFLQKWMISHPSFLQNQLFIGGDSYSGIPIPMFVQTIVDGIEAGNQPYLNLKGYVLGNPVTDSFIDMNSRIPYAHRLTLISDQIYKDTKKSCNGDYVNVNSTNYQCLADLETITQVTNDINLVHILEPYCSNAIPESIDVDSARRFLADKSKQALSSLNGPALWCRSYNHMLCYVWANLKTVQDALNVTRGSKVFWQYCNTSLAYTKSVTSVISYHQNLTNADLQALIYSGDHDMSIPHIGTQNWISTLDLTEDETWRVWSIDGQTAGYTKKLINDKFTLTYATVKGAGHFAAEYMVKECYKMIDRWMAYFPL